MATGMYETFLITTQEDEEINVYFLNEKHGNNIAFASSDDRRWPFFFSITKEDWLELKNYIDERIERIEKEK